MCIVVVARHLRRWVGRVVHGGAGMNAVFGEETVRKRHWGTQCVEPVEQKSKDLWVVHIFSDTYGRMDV